jgi:rfaE bifunctional protein kinase chain/domain
MLLMSSNTADSVRRLQRLVPRLRGKRIGVLGDLMLDRYLWGTASRLSPEAAVPVIAFESQTNHPGGAANAAANLAALRVKVAAFGLVGQDDAGQLLRKRLEESGIDARGVLADKKRVTTVKTRIIARHQHIVRVDHERREPAAADTEEELFRLLFAAIKKMDALVLSDYDKGLITDGLAERVLHAANRFKLPVFVAPKRSKLYAYRGARAVVCNEKEARAFLMASQADEKSIEEGGRALLGHFGCGAILITRGEKGMTLFEEDSPRHVHIPATSFEVTYARVGQSGIERGATGRQVFDVTGAGDTVLSVLALASAAGASLPDAAVLANIAAGVVVGKLGTATVTPEELAHALQEAS